MTRIAALLTFALLALPACQAAPPKAGAVTTEAPAAQRPAAPEPLLRAARALQTAAADRLLAFERYRELVTAFATETAVAKDSGTKVEEYEAALKAYEDARQIWMIQVGLGVKEFQPNESVKAIITPYDIKTTSRGNLEVINLYDAVGTILQAASGRIDAAISSSKS